jgi:hypothetical protein
MRAGRSCHDWAIDFIKNTGRLEVIHIIPLFNNVNQKNLNSFEPGAELQA